MWRGPVRISQQAERVPNRGVAIVRGDVVSGPASLFSFVGRWSLTREIRHADGRIDRMTGTCTFARSGPQVLQDEEGWLETGSGRFRASRRYVWKEARGQLNVHFADMRPFHSIPLGVLRPETVHLCAPDRYQVAYDFANWPVWCSVWTVEGPRKAYEMESRFALEEVAPLGA